ncbi:MAG: hypothetical protein NC247_02250 [Ruminococcus flavefaciens]|nr:hypothetical protein [Ruminococcus flavefaciens]
MKKKLMFAGLAMAVLFGRNTYAATRTPEIPEGIYATTTMVTDVDYDTDIVTVSTMSGIEYQFKGCEDWYERDFCTAMMWDNGTPDSVYDDEILQTRYTGYIEGWEWIELEIVEHEID